MDYTINKEIPLSKDQNEIVDYMLNHNYCINAAQTGIGKTYLSLTALMHILVKDKSLVGIICVPPKALKIFRKELETKLKVKYSEISTQNNISNNSRVILISHTKLEESIPLINKLLKQGREIAFILDEAHCICAENNQLTKVVKAIRPVLKYCWFLTASPCGNDIWGLYNLVSIIDENILVDKNWFKFNYLITEYQKVKKWNPFIKRYEFKMEEVIIDYKNTDDLSKRLKDVIIIRQKTYNLEFIHYKTQLNEDELSSYFKASAGFARKTAEKNFAVRLNDLTRVVDNSSPKYSDKTALSSKEKLLLSTINNLINDHILIVYTELNDNVERLNLLLHKLKAMKNNINNIFIINGATSFKERGQIEEKITNHDIIIITSAGCESINLQKADTIILYDIPFSISRSLQLFGRITRTDTKFNKQYIYTIEAEGTIDTYKRLCLDMHTSLITQLFGPMATLPYSLNLIDSNIQKRLRNKLLWSFKTKRLPTEEEINKILNNK